MNDAQAALRPRAETAIPFRPGAACAAAIALACGVAMTWAHAADIWTTGAFYDTDDAMRMVQVRDLMAGQSWFDMTAHRLDPPGGVFMHWSRTIDVPLVLLLKFFGLFAAPAQAEALARLAFPLLLLIGLYAAAAWVASLFGGRATQTAAIGLAFATGPALGQFVPGRIDHHAPQIVLLMLATGAALAAFEPARARTAALAGVAMALSLSISLENLPFFALLAILPPLAWIARGAEQAPAMRRFAFGFAGGLALCFVATVGPQRWLVVACDAYSVAHLSGGLVYAACLLALAAGSARLATPTARFCAAAVLGALPLATLRLVAPECGADPFVGLDPLVRAVWLDHVGEVQKLAALAATRPNAALTIGVPLALAALATGAVGVAARGLERARLLALAGLIAIGFAMTFWGVRVYSSAAPLAAVGGGYVAVAAAQRLARAGAARSALATLLCLPFAPMAYAAALPADAAESQSSACLRPDAVKPLDALPAGLALAPIDLGSHLLAFTRHAVVAAPYHRANHGDRLAIDAFLAPPDAAARIARESGADYLVVCPALKQMRVMAERAPQGLAAALLAGRAPDWLEPLDIPAAPNKIYRIRR